MIIINKIIKAINKAGSYDCWNDATKLYKINK